MFGMYSSLFAGFWVFTMIWSLVALLGFIFWVWMLADCLKRDFKDKIIWVVVIVFLNIVGALLYYFIVKQENTSPTPPPSIPPTPPTSVS